MTELREDIKNVIQAKSEGKDQNSGKIVGHVYTDKEKFEKNFNAEALVPLNDAILRLTQPNMDFMGYACHMVDLSVDDVMSLLKDKERRAIECRSKYVLDLVKQLREVQEEKIMQLTQMKTANEALNEKEEYLADNHIFAEYIFFNSY